MKKILYRSIIALVAILLTNNVLIAQCNEFNSQAQEKQLDPKNYISDGHNRARQLMVGEEANLYKTFFSGNKYRLVVAASEQLPKIEFKVFDLQQNLLYDNCKNDLANSWDFQLESSQMLVISVKVPKTSPVADETLGCVSVLIGVKNSAE